MTKDIEKMTKEELEEEIKRIEGKIDIEAVEGTEIPSLAQLGMDIITSTVKQFKRRWGYKSSKRRDKAVIKNQKLQAHFTRQSQIEEGNDNGLKAYTHRNNTEVRLRIIDWVGGIVTLIISPIVAVQTVLGLLMGG